MISEEVWHILSIIGNLCALWALVRVTGLALGWWGWDNEKKDWTDGE